MSSRDFGYTTLRNITAYQTNGNIVPANYILTTSSNGAGVFTNTITPNIVNASTINVSSLNTNNADIDLLIVSTISSTTVVNILNIQAGINDTIHSGMSEFIRTSSSGTRTTDYQVTNNNYGFTSGDIWQDARFVYSVGNSPTLAQVWGIVTRTNASAVGSNIGDMRFFHNVIINEDLTVQSTITASTICANLLDVTFLSTTTHYTSSIAADVVTASIVNTSIINTNTINISNYLQTVSSYTSTLNVVLTTFTSSLGANYISSNYITANVLNTNTISTVSTITMLNGTNTISFTYNGTDVYLGGYPVLTEGSISSVSSLYWDDTAGDANLTGAIFNKNTGQGVNKYMVGIGTSSLNGTLDVHYTAGSITGNAFNISSNMNRFAVTNTYGANNYITANLINNQADTLGPSFALYKTQNFNSTVSTCELGFIDFYGMNPSLSSVRGAVIRAEQTGPASALATTDLQFITCTSSASTVQMVITSAGNVGVGITSPYVTFQTAVSTNDAVHGMAAQHADVNTIIGAYGTFGSIQATRNSNTQPISTFGLALNPLGGDVYIGSSINNLYVYSASTFISTLIAHNGEISSLNASTITASTLNAINSYTSSLNASTITTSTLNAINSYTSSLNASTVNITQSTLTASLNANYISSNLLFTSTLTATGYVSSYAIISQLYFGAPNTVSHHIITDFTSSQYSLVECYTTSGVSLIANSHERNFSLGANNISQLTFTYDSTIIISSPITALSSLIVSSISTTLLSTGFLNTSSLNTSTLNASSITTSSFGTVYAHIEILNTSSLVTSTLNASSITTSSFGAVFAYTEIFNTSSLVASSITVSTMLSVPVIDMNNGQIFGISTLSSNITITGSAISRVSCSTISADPTNNLPSWIPYFGKYNFINGDLHSTLTLPSSIGNFPNDGTVVVARNIGGTTSVLVSSLSDSTGMAILAGKTSSYVFTTVTGGYGGWWGL